MSQSSYSLSLKLNSIEKLQNQNAIIMSFALEPSNLPIYNTLNWATYISTDIQNTKLQVTYDSSTQ
jgi:hypothetical protein